MPATIESPRKTDAEPERRNRIFKVVDGYVGKFPPGHPFSESYFAQLNPIPEKAINIDRATYYDALLNRLIVRGAIIEAPGETPRTVSDSPMPDAKNPGIAEATEALLKNKRNLEAQRQADLDSIHTAGGTFPRNTPKVDPANAFSIPQQIR